MYRATCKYCSTLAGIIACWHTVNMPPPPLCHAQSFPEFVLRRGSILHVQVCSFTKIYLWIVFTQYWLISLHFNVKCACCCCPTVASCCCACCPSCRSSTSTRIVYTLFLLIGTILSCVMLSSGIQDTMVEKVTKSLSKSKDDDIEVMQMWGLTIISFSAQKFWVNFDFFRSPLKMLASITVCPFLTISPQAMTQKKVHLTIWIHVQREQWWEWRKYQPRDIAWFKSTFGGLKLDRQSKW